MIPVTTRNGLRFQNMFVYFSITTVPGVEKIAAIPEIREICFRCIISMRTQGNNQLENLIPLCSVCHLQIEKEARLHAPHAHIQHELFEDSSYLESMATLRKEAFERYGQKQKNSISNMSDEEYEQYLNQKEWEE